jgi:N-acetylmuramoyl-L-alanine amidase CwlA
MVINRKICPTGLKNNPNRLLKSVSFVTIHTTGNRSATATAKSHAEYQYSGSGGAEKSWHYTIDKDEVWQSFEDLSECWHAGDGNNGPGNYTSIGLEICVNDRAGFAIACDKAAWLTAILLRRHKLTVDKIVQHNHWVDKNCPAELRSGEWGVTWAAFINLVQQYLGMASITGPLTEKPTPERIIEVLSKKASISSPDYWVSVLKGDVAVNLGYLNTLFTRLAGFDI